MTKLKGTKLGPGFKLDKEGRIIKDYASSEAKLDVCTRLKRRGSKRIKAVKPGIRPG
jgi:hypothetical protein